jgi:hypothetical protein
MANNTLLDAGSGGDTIRTLDKTSYKTPVSAIDLGGTGAESLLTVGQQAMAASVPVVLASDQTVIPISDNSGSLTVDGTVAISGSVTVADGGGAISVDDNSGSLTVDAPVGTPVFVRLSDGSSAIATLPVSLASVPSHAVTNAGTFVVQENGAALTALQLIDDAVGTVASAIPTKGLVARARTAPTRGR